MEVTRALVNFSSLVSMFDSFTFEKGWEKNKEQQLLYEACRIYGVKVIFEIGEEENNALERIKFAIKQVTGLDYEDYCEGNRKRERVFARMIFSKMCEKENLKAVNHLDRGRHTIRYYQKNYDSEKQFNKEFREWADKVEEIINR